VPPTHHVGPERAGLVAVAVVAALIGVALVALGPDRSASSDAVVDAVRTPDRASAPATSTPSSSSSAIARPSTTVSATKPPGTTTAAPAGAPPPTTVDPGTLPQTDERPTASGAQFDAGVQGLWHAITSDDPASALPFFFPQSAYVQVKAISDPVGDYHSRLIANFEQDIHALHTQVGADGSRAKLGGLTVPGDQAVWVQPGAEYNKGSYWRVYGSTLHYTVDDQDHSFPVSSLISWRGQWYVVHLGEIR
jgi:hypothetical protein